MELLEYDYYNICPNIDYWSGDIHSVFCTAVCVGEIMMTDKRFIHLHIIRIDYPVGTDIKDTEPMINYIKSVIRRETGTEPEIEEYLL